MSALPSRLTLSLWLGLGLGLGLAALPAPVRAAVSVAITLAPPPLPIYAQPPIPQAGYLWTPGYWDYGPDGYFWVPGTWVEPPEIGLLWTPGYWGWSAGAFVWNVGYWGPHVGFYGGIDYGFGYTGHGYEGGEWRGRDFFYNRTVNHVNVSNVYSKAVANSQATERVSYNGGAAGARTQPTADEQAAAREGHRPPTPLQVQHRDAASSQRELLASVNRGKPAIAATAKPAQFPGNAEARSRSTGPTAAAVHPSELPKPEGRAPVSSGDTRRDQLFEKQRADLQAKHDRERSDLQQKQMGEHDRLAQRPTDPSRSQALERQHQSQTQALQLRHSAEQQRLERTQQRSVAHQAPKEPPRRPTSG